MSFDMAGIHVESLAQLRDILKNSKRLVFLYLYTHWSPPCRCIRMEYNDAVKFFSDKVKYLSCDLDKAPAIMEQLKVGLDDIPALVVFKFNEKLDTKLNIKSHEFAELSNYPMGDADDVSKMSEHSK